MTTEPTEQAMTTEVKIEQIDREAQAQLYANIGKPGMAEEIRAGQQDDHPGVQAFARHRLSALQQPDERDAASEGRLAEALAVIAYEDPMDPWRIAHDALKGTARPLATERDAQSEAEQVEAIRDQLGPKFKHLAPEVAEELVKDRAAIRAMPLPTTDEIERLSAEIERLRAALEEIWDVADVGSEPNRIAFAVLRAALKDHNHDD